MKFQKINYKYNLINNVRLLISALLHMTKPCGTAHRDIFFRNLMKENRNQIPFTILRLIWNQTDVRLVPNQSENGESNLIFV